MLLFHVRLPNLPVRSHSQLTSHLVARVKKIIATDPDVSNCSNNAAFMITVAAEMFIQHLVEQSYNVVKSERKPRRNIQYRDVGVYSRITRITGSRPWLTHSPF